MNKSPNLEDKKFSLDPLPLFAYRPVLSLYFYIFLKIYLFERERKTCGWGGEEGAEDRGVGQTSTQQGVLCDVPHGAQSPHPPLPGDHDLSRNQEPEA